MCVCVCVCVCEHACAYVCLCVYMSLKDTLSVCVLSLYVSLQLSCCNDLTVSVQTAQGPLVIGSKRVLPSTSPCPVWGTVSLRWLTSLRGRESKVRIIRVLFVCVHACGCTSFCVFLFMSIQMDLLMGFRPFIL